MEKQFLPHRPKVTNATLYAIIFLSVLVSCSVTRQADRLVKTELLTDSLIKTGHAGISIYEPATGKYWCNYQADQYFIPSSNAKLFTLYAGLKYLGDSIPAARLLEEPNGNVYLLPAGDPSFLSKAFQQQPLFDYLKQLPRHTPLLLDATHWQAQPWGSGWVWDDYSESFMPERSVMPVYDNLVHFGFRNQQLQADPPFLRSIIVFPELADEQWSAFDRLQQSKLPPSFALQRRIGSNEFKMIPSNTAFKGAAVPFKTGNELLQQLLQDTLPQLEISLGEIKTPLDAFRVLYSRPADSLYRPMMWTSDNFMAEQTLLMVSDKLMGKMDDHAMIDSLLNHDFINLPQRPVWVDGSGLSRYNLFTPQSMVYVLDKLQQEFGLDRMKRILPTGGQGTLKNYYQADSGFIYAKTGSMSNQLSLSGYLITRRKKLLIFSVMLNNVQGPLAHSRLRIAHLLADLRKKY